MKAIFTKTHSYRRDEEVNPDVWRDGWIRKKPRDFCIKIVPTLTSGVDFSKKT